MCKDCGCNNQNSTATIAVMGMTCGHCTESVEKTLLALPGVLSAKADLDKKNVTVHFQNERGDVEAMKQAIDNLGFEAGTAEVQQGHSHGVMSAIKKLFR